MSIKPVDKNMQKGLAIIVGNKPDGILLHTASILGTKQMFLSKADLKNIKRDTTIYLIGHGTHNKAIWTTDFNLKSFNSYMIDSKGLYQIAKELVEAGYDGTQRLYPVVCHYELMHDKFKKHLEDLLSNKTNQISVRVVNRSRGYAILIEGNGGELWCGEKENAEQAKDMQKQFLKIYNMAEGCENINVKQKKMVSAFKNFLMEDFK